MVCVPVIAAPAYVRWSKKISLREVTFKLKLEWREGVSYGSSGGKSFQVARMASAISWRHLCV